MYSNTGWEIHVRVYTKTFVYVFLFVQMNVFIYTGFFLLIREILSTGFCILVSLPICEVYRGSQPKSDSKNWGFPTLVPVVSSLICCKKQV